MSTEIKGRQVMKVIALAGEHSYNVEKDSPMHGLKYRRFAYLGKAFAVNTADKFCKAFDDENLYSIDLDTNDEGQLSLVGFTTQKQEINMAKTESTLVAIASSTAFTSLSEEELAELEKES